MATVQTIDAKSLHQLMEQKPDLRLVDVRTPAEFQTVHAVGASPAPLNELNPQAFPASGEPIYFICKGGVRSRQAAELFLKAGRTNVVSVDGGTDAWVSAGLPVERGGRNVLPLDRQVQMTAGLICLAGVILGTWANPWWYLLSAMVGMGMTMAGLTGFCPMGILLAKMPWNQGGSCATGSCCCSPRK